MQQALPLSIQSKFSDTYDGMPAARLNSSVQTKALEAELSRAGLTYRTKIVGNKKRGWGYVVVLPKVAHAA